MIWTNNNNNNNSTCNLEKYIYIYTNLSFYVSPLGDDKMVQL